MRASLANSSGMSPYLDAQLIDIGLLEQSHREANSWRRLSFCLIFVALVSVSIALVLATKDHVEALVYKEDASGDIALMGRTASSHIPSDLAIVHQLTLWIEYVRDIPYDPELVERNAHCVLTMTAQGSPAESAYRNFMRTNNPKSLAREGYKRSVLSVEVDPLTKNTYRIAWTESLMQNGNQISAKTSYDGTVTIAPNPQVPIDPAIGQINPAGIYIQSFEMRWSLLH